MVATILASQQPAFRPGAGYDPAAEALFARMTVQPDATRKGLINNCIVALKAAGIWTKLEALYFTAAHDVQAGELNWISSSFNLTPINSPAFTADRGYAGNAISSYLATGWAPSTSGIFLQDSASFGCYLNAGTDTASDAAAAMGSLNTNGSFLFPRGGSGFLRGRVNQATTANATGAIATRLGLSALSRTAAGLVTAYRNGASAGTFANASAAKNSATFYLMGVNNAGSLVSPVDNRIAMAFMGAALDATENTALYNATITLLTAIGAN